MPREWTEEQKAEASERARALWEQRHAADAATAGAVDEEPVAPPEEIAAEPEQDIDGFTAEERDEIARQVQAKIDEELAARAREERKIALGKAYDEELQKQRRLAGLTDAGDDLVEFLVNVAPFSPGLVIDGKVYPHGSWVKMTRRQYDSVRDIMARSWESEDRAGNPNKKFADWRAMAGTTNPMMREQRMPDGTFTVGAAPSVAGNVNHALSYPVNLP